MTTSRSFQLQAANTLLLLVVGLLVIVTNIDAPIEEALLFTLYAVGALVLIFAFGIILKATRDGDDQ